MATYKKSNNAWLNYIDTEVPSEECHTVNWEPRRRFADSPDFNNRYLSK